MVEYNYLYKLDFNMKTLFRKKVVLFGLAAVAVLGISVQSQAEKEASVTAIDVSPSTVRYSGGDFVQQANALYMVSQIVDAPDSFLSAVSSCKVDNPKPMCKELILKSQYAIDAYKAIHKNENHCGDVCKFYSKLEFVMNSENTEPGKILVTNPVSKGPYNKE